MEYSPQRSHQVSPSATW